MRKYASVLTAALLCLSAAALFGACTSHDGAGAKRAGTSVTTPAGPQAAKAVPNDGARRITIPELRKALAADEAIVVDVRDANSYKNGHIAGARLIPLNELPAHLGELPKDKLIVFYCA